VKFAIESFLIFLYKFKFQVCLKSDKNDIIFRILTCIYIYIIALVTNVNVVVIFTKVTNDSRFVIVILVPWFPWLLNP
jgi:hypothetical protein